jgi:hypothetical protein
MSKQVCRAGIRGWLKQFNSHFPRIKSIVLAPVSSLFSLLPFTASPAAPLITQEEKALCY